MTNYEALRALDRTVSELHKLRKENELLLKALSDALKLIAALERKND